MTIQFDLISTITLFGIAQGLFLGVILLRMKRGNRRAKRLLAVLLFVISVSVFIYAVVQPTNLKYYLPWLIGWSLPLIFLYGPLYRFYVLALIDPAFRLRPRHLLHLIPAAACTAFLLPFYLQEPSSKIAFLVSDPTFDLLHNPFTSTWLLAVVHVIVYIVVSKKPLYRYGRSIKRIFSNIDRINFRWLRIFIPFFSLGWYLILIATVIEAVFIRRFVISNYIPVMVTACFFLFGYIGMLQHDSPPALPAEERKNPKYVKSTLDEKDSKRILASLHEYMTQKRPFLDPELTLPDLADRMGVNRNDLSQAINENTGSNFYDLVNGYRIEETKRLLTDPEKKNLTFLALALEAGFNSKATFNTAFRKHAGMTPSQFVATCRS
jgi:AraC-like DNA-binding protein